MKTVAAAMIAVLFAPALLRAQETPQFPEPTKEHEWLHQFVGEWDVESEGSMGPDQPPMKCKGTIKSRKLGGFWVLSEMNADMMGTNLTAIQTLGYDAKTKKYVGTWVDSMMDHMWKYQGSVDSTGKILTLEAEGPDMLAEGKTRKYRDVFEFKSKDEVVMRSEMLGDDGKWVAFMTGTAKRTK